MYKTTPEQFEMFKREALRWQEYFGIKDWDISFRHEKAKGVRAEVSFDAWGRIAAISLNTHWETDEPTDEMVRKSAFHEVCELMFGQIHNMLTQKEIYNAADDSTKELHKIIRILENTVFKEAK